MSVNNTMSEEQIMEKLLSTMGQEFMEELKGKSINWNGKLNHRMFRQLDTEHANSIMRQFFAGLGTKSEYIRKLDGVRDIEIVQTVLAIMIDDAFINTSDSADFFKVEYDPKTPGNLINEAKTKSKVKSKIQKEIDTFMDKIELQSLMVEILEDILFYGEYHLQNEYRKGEGIVELVDNIDVADVLPIYRNQKPVLYLVAKNSYRNSTFLQGATVLQVEPSEISSFIVSKKKIRLRSDDRFTFSAQEKVSIPEHIRMGRSCIYPVLGRLQQLQLTELSSKVSSLKEMVMPVVVSVGVPANTTPQDLKSITQTYENSINGMLNDAFQAMQGDGSSFEEVVSRLASSGVRVMPNFSDSKGALSQVDLGMSEARRQKDESEDSMRNKVARALFIPPHYLNPQERPEGRMNDLKMYSRYTRKLLSMQDAVAQGIRSIIVSHIRLKDGTVVNPEDIKVKFKSLVDMDLLDSMEFTVASVQVMSDLSRLIQDIERGEMGLEFDSKQVKNILMRLMVPLEPEKSLIKVVPKQPAAGGDMGGDMGGGFGGGFGTGDEFGGGGGDDFADEEPVEEEPAPEEPIEEEPVEEKPKRKPRKKPAAKRKPKKDDSDEEDTEEEPKKKSSSKKKDVEEEEDTADSEEEPKKKTPPKKKAASKKKDDEELDDSEESETEESETEESDTEEKPKKKTPPKKKAASKKDDDEEIPLDDEEEVPDEEEKKPTRKRTSKKKPSAKKDKEEEVDDEEIPDEEEKPKKKTTRSKTK